MTSPRTITLFAEYPDSRSQQASFAASIMAHGGLIALISFAILYTPRLDRRALANRYTVRQLDLQTPERPMRRSAADQIAYPGPRVDNSAATSGGKQTARAAVLPQIPHLHHGPQTLVQPDIHTDLTLTQLTPVPQVVLWTPAAKPVTKIVAPPPAQPPTASVVPRLEPPNPEPNLSDIAVASVTQPSLKQLIVPSTTTPIVVERPKPVVSTPATVSQASAKPAPAAVVSLSDLRMKNGTVVLPPVNESAATSASGSFSLTPGQAKTPSAAGNGNPAIHAAGNGQVKAAQAGNGKSQGNHPTTQTASSAAGQGAGARSPAAGSGTAPGLQAQGGDTGADQGSQASVTQINLPKDGQFGSVIVGASIEDDFPEVSDVWQGRMAYTVYLHVGAAKSWILQYSLPRDAGAAEAGAIGHLEAPWPYSIVRPNLAPDSIDTDAVMIHGYVNDAGRFDKLSVVFPPQFPQAKFVLDSLQRWQFRPASQNGQIAPVEVLLIIPEEFE
ncbi:MAG TPA: hypothetical protein VHX20_12110 [Terracidiphilus sp.]|jgi:hypothetical protein|nr:hypothetical protein [Terracidiphilus sp.]